jgi:Zn-dependent membrane protease YugP
MQGTVKWIASGLVGIIGIFGLFLAANAHDRGIYLFGLGLAAFAVIYIFAQMKQGFDASDRARSARSTGFETAEGGLVGRITP